MEEKVSCRSEKEPVALHVLVVGFHHKKGMQVEYAYPPLSDVDNGCELPDKWKYLPSLCLPDGAHNHEADTIYFHLPHLYNDTQTVFGVSCYRQIDAEKVANKTADITRNTVQKSVCVLTTLPIYGYVQERLKVTTKVYFKGADFSDVRDLEGLYNDLNNTNWKDRLMHGICVSEAVHIFGRNILVLFKLLLLERKVLFYNSPVAPLGNIITSLLALLPANLPEGLAQAAASSNECYKTVETNMELSGEATQDSSQYEEIELEGHNLSSVIEEPQSELIASGFQDENLSKIVNVAPYEEIVTSCEALPEGILIERDDISEFRSSASSLTSVTSRGSLMSPFQSPHSASYEGTADNSTNFTARFSSFKGKLSGALNYWSGKEKLPSPTIEKRSSTTTPNPSPSELGDDTPVSPSSGMPFSDLSESSVKSESQNTNINAEKYALLEPQECGLPLQIFTKGNILHPYLSLQYLDVLTAPSTRAFVAGASNALFIHKKNLYEVGVQLSDGRIEISDPDLKRQLSLSIEDLRFAENLVRQVDAVNASISEGAYSSTADVFLDGVGWMGGEEWLRHQFKVYLLALLRSSVCPDVSREYEVFNSSFMSAWKETHNYRMWLAGGPYPSLNDLSPGHPHAGNLSMTDMRIRLSHTIQGLDRGRRLNHTFASTGTAVVKTKEAVGGAITSAKGALTNLWSSMTTSNTFSAERDGGPEEAEEAQECNIPDSKEDTFLTVEGNSLTNGINDLSKSEQADVAPDIVNNSC